MVIAYCAYMFTDKTEYQARVIYRFASAHRFINDDAYNCHESVWIIPGMYNELYGED